MAAKFTIEGVFKMAVGGAMAPITRLGNRVGKVTRSINKNLSLMNARLKRVGKSARGAFGLAGMAGALLLAQQAAAAVISTGAEFEQTIVGAAARFPEEIGKGTAAFRELEAVARGIGATTEFTSKQAAGGLNFMAKAGKSAAVSMAVLPGLVDLATASELDLARASDIASDAMGAFGQDTKDAALFQKRFKILSDRMAKTTNIANVNMEELFETIKKGAPAATAAGVPMETFLGLTAQFASAGLKASDSGTALKNIFLRLAKTDVQKKMRSIGVAVKASSGEMRPFADIMDDLLNSTKELSKIERAGVLDELFGLRGITGVANVLAAGTDSLRDFQNEIVDSENFTKDLAKVLRDTLGGEMKVLSASVESLNLSFFKANSEGISGMVTGLTSVVQSIDKFVTAHPQVARMTAGIVLMGVALLAIGALAAGAVAAIGAFIGSTIAIVAAAVAILVGFIATILGNFETFFGNFKASLTSIPFIGERLFGEEKTQTLPAGQGVISKEDRQRDVFASLQGLSGTALLKVLAPEGSVELDAGDLAGAGVLLEPTGAF